MDTLTIDASLIRAALANCVKPKSNKDHVQNLDCIWFSTSGQLVATNGHTLYKAQYCLDGSAYVKENVLLKVHGAIPTSAVSVDIDFDSQIIRTNNAKAFPCTVVDGEYINYEKPIAEAGFDQDAIVSKIFNASYLAGIEKTFGFDTVVKLTIRGSKSACRVEPIDNPYEELLLIMPRLESD